jgi:hypothetical protein
MRVTKRVAGALLLLYMVRAAGAQCQGKNGFALAVCQAKAARAAMNTKGGGNAVAPSQEVNNKPPALTTSWAVDAIHSDTLPSTVELTGPFRDLRTLDRADDGAFILKPGIFEVTLEGYSLEKVIGGDIAGTGFFPAPVKGRRAAAIVSVLKLAELHPDVSQAEIAALLTAIVADTNLENMPPAVQKTAAEILPPDIRAQLQGPPDARRAQNQRTSPVPVSVSTAPSAGLNLAFGRGSWVRMQGEWFLRILPDGYSKIRLQLIVPYPALTPEKTPLIFDPVSFLAVSPAGVRLGMTLRSAR